MPIKLCLYGDLPRKSNSRRLVRNRHTGLPMLIKSQKALDYEKMFASQLTGNHKKNLEECISISGVVYYQSRRHDLSIELLLDLLEKYGVIKNDRQVHFINIAKNFDKNNPRVEIIIEEINYEDKIREFNF